MKLKTDKELFREFVRKRREIGAPLTTDKDLSKEENKIITNVSKEEGNEQTKTT